MPNGRTHGRVGIVSGGVSAALRSVNQPPEQRILEVIGGMGGGYVGGRLPDWLEPAYCGWHRQFCHSVTAGAGVISLGRNFLESWEGWCREKAEAVRVRRLQLDPGSGGAAFLVLVEALLRVLAGVLAGIVAGYVSHLILDAGSPRSIGLI